MKIFTSHTRLYWDVYNATRLSFVIATLAGVPRKKFNTPKTFLKITTGAIFLINMVKHFRLAFRMKSGVDLVRGIGAVVSATSILGSAISSLPVPNFIHSMSQKYRGYLYINRVVNAFKFKDRALKSVVALAYGLRFLAGSLKLKETPGDLLEATYRGLSTFSIFLRN